MKPRQRPIENHVDDWQRLLDGMEADPLSYTESRLILPAYDLSPHRPDEDVWLDEEILHFAFRPDGGDRVSTKGEKQWQQDRPPSLISPTPGNSSSPPWRRTPAISSTSSPSGWSSWTS